MESLTLKYRPRTFQDVTGQRSVRAVLHQMVKKDQVPTAMVFSGVRGSGKTSTARILAAALNCDAWPEGPCTTCVQCKATYDGTSTAVTEIDAASNGLVDDIRRIRDLVMYATDGRKRLVLLDEAHSMQKAAFNALLKTLEEPPPDTHFILLTTEPRRILETVLSRCMVFEFRMIPVADIHDRLRFICQQESTAVDDDLLLYLAERADGGLRDAVMSLDQVSRVGITTLEEFAEMVGESDFGPGIVAAMVDGDRARVFSLVGEQLQRVGDPTGITAQITKTLKAILMLKAGAVIPVQGKALEARQALSGRLETERVVAAMQVLWDLKTKVRVSDDAGMVLDLAAVMMTEALCTKRVVIQAPQNGSHKLSLQDMRSFV